jgi:hypothetical protein
LHEHLEKLLKRISTIKLCRGTKREMLLRLTKERRRQRCTSEVVERRRRRRREGEILFVLSCP